MIDLRSDTVTRPSSDMRRAMSEAEVGDDVYGDDPTVRALEEETAAILGKEDAVFVPTGSMSNQIAVRTLTEPGDLVLIERRAHIVLNEGGGGAALSGVTMRPLEGEHGVFTAAQLDEHFPPEHPFNARTLKSPPTLLCLENTHNAAGGTVWELDALREACRAGRGHGLSLHLDGARLWHATAASGISERDFAAPFDAVNVCFSKGLGAPVGSALAGSRDLIRRARRFRQQFGGGMRQAGVIAAGALFALRNHRADLGRDVAQARRFAERIAQLDGVRVNLKTVQSNIVRFEVERDSGSVSTECHAGGLHMLPNGRHGLRAVFHRDVPDGDVDRAYDVLEQVMSSAVTVS